MKRMNWLFILLLLPFCALASDTLYTSQAMAFTPTTGDASIVYLGNIFGSVDGVLHGTGSQIMGTMLAVFNSAVLALGGIVIMYIIIVSTMNTAHEGEMLGHKWSSIWVPIRTVIGLALLIPKTSGYCLMQIFVMWVVVQGVGVADKIWGSALNYLNRGGVIIKASSSLNTVTQTGGNTIGSGAATILYGQVCMLGLQKQLENTRQSYLDQASTSNGEASGPCAGTPSATMQAFCDNPVPDFINSVNPLEVQMDAESGDSSPSSYSVTMPNLDSSSVYAFLNGICGTLAWNAVNTDALTTTKQVNFGGKTKQVETPVISSMTTTDMDVVKLTRGMAVQQMYTSLATTAELMVNNDPQINLNKASNTNNASLVAVDQFGVPLNGSVLCQSGSDSCTSWGAGPKTSASIAVLLQGTEFQGAMADYNTMMAPTLKLMSEAQNATTANNIREFLKTAEETGWIMAGSYFFNLVQLNGNASPTNEVDQNSGLDKSTFDLSQITSVFQKSSCSGPYANLCIYFNNDETPLDQIVYLIDGSAQKSVSQPSFSSANASYPIASGTAASTVYGYVDNSLNLVLPGEPGMKKLNLNNLTPADMNLKPNFAIPKASGRGSCEIRFMGICFFNTSWLTDLLINDVILNLLNTFLELIAVALMYLANALIYGVIYGFTYIFVEGIKILDTEGINPVVALAKMGITYINFASSAWIGMAIAAATAAMIPYAGPPIFALLTLLVPIFFAWIGAMLGIGFITAYYIPFLPYMLFMFGAIGWLITVIEAMVAAPIVALGVAYPEGHDAMGKSEQGLMILLNVFLRPGMMVIGYIAGIALSYVGVWLMSAGFQNIFSYMTGPSGWGDATMPWAYIFSFFFSSLLYTTTYLTIVQKSFTLIAVLPDKVLRWIGGQSEQTGQETTQWAEEGKSQMKEAIQPTTDAAAQMAKQAGGYLGKGAEKLMGKKKDDESGVGMGGGGG